MKRFLFISLVVCACGKDDPPPPEIFAGDYLLLEIEEEHSTFEAPDVYQIINTEFLDPTTGERFPAYKYQDEMDRFMGMAQTEEFVIVGTDACPNGSGLDGVSLTYLPDSSVYRLNMRNCEGREIIAVYSIK